MNGLREGFKGDQNQNVLDNLIQEVKVLNDTFEVEQIRDIAIAIVMLY